MSPGAKLFLLVCACLPAGLLACRAAEEAEPAGEGQVIEERLALEPGEALERDLVPGETHVYSFAAVAGDYLELVVDQRGIDVTTLLVDPRGGEVARADRPIGRRGPEALIALVAEDGVHQLRIGAGASNRPTGSYGLTVTQRRSATEADRAREAAARTFVRGNDLRRAGEGAEAASAFEEALARWREIGDPFWEAESLFELGRQTSGTESAAYSAESAALYKVVGLRRLEAMAHEQRGATLVTAGETEEGIVELDVALNLLGDSGGTDDRARVIRRLADAHQRRGEIDAALKLYEEVIELAGPIGPLGAASSHSLGVLSYRALGEPERALRYFEEADEAFARLGWNRASTLHQKGRVLQRLGRTEEALASYEQALSIWRDQKQLIRQAVTLTSIGEARDELDDAERAFEAYRQALAILSEFDDPWAEARTRRGIGALHARLSRNQQARDAYRGSVELYRKVGDSLGEADTLLGLARVERALGDLEAARTTSAVALGLAEARLPRGLTDQIRTSYFATFQPHFDFHIDLLMELGDEAAAFEASERARSRSLLDLLAEARIDLQSEANTELTTQEGRLLREISALEYQRSLLYDRSPERLTRVEGQLSDLNDALSTVHTQIRLRDPRYAEMTRPEPLGLAEIQRLLSEEGTALLEYRLGDRRSFGWLVTPASLTGFELPGRAEIEERVRRAYGLLERSRARESGPRTQRVLCDLSRDLLEPVGDRLDESHLMVVLDGALQYVPFATLADPRQLDDCEQAPPLASRHLVNYLPSASTLAVLQQDRRPRPDGVIAVIADPVFGDRPGPYQRLPHAQDEGLAILDLVDADESFRAFGFDANKETVLSDVLGRYRLLHFATHGVFNTERPELSGLVLSGVDRQGRPREPLLLAPEVYKMKLAADLAVLSGCKTALGKEVRGEGLVGLTRGFMYAGATQVLVSLWEVSDSSTSILMRHFYGGLLEDGLRPEAALRAAQIAMWQEGYTPFHWGAFTLQGASL